MLNYEILEKLTRTIGVSGEEDDVRSVILSEISRMRTRFTFRRSATFWRLKRAKSVPRRS